MHRQIAGKLTSPVTKWVVLVAVLILTGVMGALGSKLADVKNNEQSSWVPSSAESTRVADQISKTVDPNDIPTLVVYHRSGGLTDADLASIEEAGQQIGGLKGVTDAGVITPGTNPAFLSQDGEVAYTYFTFNFGKDGWNKLEKPVKQVKELTAIDGVDVHVGGYGGQAYDFISSFGDSHITLLLMTFGVVILILLSPPQPGPLDPADPQRRHRQHDGGRRGLPAGQVRRAGGQRPEPIHPEHPGDRGRHRLRTAARRPLPRGASSPRGPPRSHGVRPPPGCTGDHRQRRHGRRRPDVPVVRRPQLHGEPRAGPRGRRRHHAVRDGHPATGPAGHLRALDLLARPAHLRLGRAHPERSVGAGR